MQFFFYLTTIFGVKVFKQMEIKQGDFSVEFFFFTGIPSWYFPVLLFAIFSCILIPFTYFSNLHPPTLVSSIFV